MGGWGSRGKKPAQAAWNRRFCGGGGHGWALKVQEALSRPKGEVIYTQGAVGESTQGLESPGKAGGFLGDPLT